MRVVKTTVGSEMNGHLPDGRLVVISECVQPFLHHTIPYELHGAHQFISDPRVLQGANIFLQNGHEGRSEHLHRAGR